MSRLLLTFDTNCFLTPEGPRVIYECAKGILENPKTFSGVRVFVPKEVLDEIDRLKSCPRRGFAAREASRLLTYLLERDRHLVLLQRYFDKKSNSKQRLRGDAAILNAIMFYRRKKNTPALLITGDRTFRLLCLARGVDDVLLPTHSRIGICYDDIAQIESRVRRMLKRRWDRDEEEVSDLTSAMGSLSVAHTGVSDNEDDDDDHHHHHSRNHRQRRKQRILKELAELRGEKENESYSMPSGCLTLEAYREAVARGRVNAYAGKSDPATKYANGWCFSLTRRKWTKWMKKKDREILERRRSERRAREASLKSELKDLRKEEEEEERKRHQRRYPRGRNLVLPAWMTTRPKKPTSLLRA